MTTEHNEEMKRFGTWLTDGQRKVIAYLEISASVTQVTTLGGILFHREEPKDFQQAARLTVEANAPTTTNRIGAQFARVRSGPRR